MSDKRWYFDPSTMNIKEEPAHMTTQQIMDFLVDWHRLDRRAARNGELLLRGVTHPYWNVEILWSLAGGPSWASFRTVLDRLVSLGIVAPEPRTYRWRLT